MLECCHPNPNYGVFLWVPGKQFEQHGWAPLQICNKPTCWGPGCATRWPELIDTELLSQRNWLTTKPCYEALSWGLQWKNFFNTGTNCLLIPLRQVGPSKDNKMTGLTGEAHRPPQSCLQHGQLSAGRGSSSWRATESGHWSRARKLGHTSMELV